MLFNASSNVVIAKYRRNRLPCNSVSSGEKQVEYYSSLDNALDNLMRVVVNNGFTPVFLKDVFDIV